MKPSSFISCVVLLRWIVRVSALAALLGTAAGLSAETKPSSWAELKAYHGVMAATFHPAEGGNLEPVKTRSGELASVAKAWMLSTPPADFNKPAIVDKLKLLQAESVALDTLVKGKKATDAEIKAALFKLHDRFHEIVGACRDEGKDLNHPK